MRRFLLLMLGLATFPCIMFAQSYFGNFGGNQPKTLSVPQRTQGTSIPAPIPAIASPQEFRASIAQAPDQNRVSTQYQELLAKQPPLVQKTPSLAQPTTPPPPPVPPSPTSTTTVSTTTTKPAAAPPPAPPTVIQAAPTAPQVQIERAPATTTTTTQTTTPATTENSLMQQPTQTQVYTGFQTPTQKNAGNQGTNTVAPSGTQNNKQGGWNIKY